jgi:hypothetical protein
VAGAQQATVEAEVRPAEGVQLTAPVVVALPATLVAKAHLAPAAAETRLGAAATAPQ